MGAQATIGHTTEPLAGTCHGGRPACFLVRWGALAKTLAQRRTHGGENLPAFWSTTEVSFSHLVSRQSVTLSQALGGGLAAASPTEDQGGGGGLK